MATAKELTGGLGDVNPQTLTVDVVQTGTDELTAIRVAIPRPRFIPSKGKSIVLEILRVQADKGTPFVSLLATQQEVSVEVSTSGNFGIAEPDVLVHFAWIRTLLIASDFVKDQFEGLTRDLSDGAGHGFLVGTDELVFRILSFNTEVTNRVVIRILYRYKAVDITEYIGIVQSQI